MSLWFTDVISIHEVLPCVHHIQVFGQPYLLAPCSNKLDWDLMLAEHAKLSALRQNLIENVCYASVRIRGLLISSH